MSRLSTAASGSNTATGQPLTSPIDGTDLPNAPIQYDVVGDDFLAGAMDPGACTGGATCHAPGRGMTLPRLKGTMRVAG